MILWSWDFVRPIRRYFARRRRSRWKQRWSKGTCPSCKLSFDDNQKRCVLDSCGHRICYSCLCSRDVCPFCPRAVTTQDRCDNNFQNSEVPESLLTNESQKWQVTSISNQPMIPNADLRRPTLCNEEKEKKRFSRISSLSIESLFDETVPAGPVNHLTLKPLYFEVPQLEADFPFLPREWVFQEINKVVKSSNLRGVVLVGDVGSGKTSLILQLVELSCFGRKRNSSVIITDNVTIEGVNRKSSEISTLELLASHVVGYHFCQAECIETCLIPDFIHSLAAQLCQAPQLVEYRNFLIRDESCQQLLNLDACIKDPDRAFLKGIIEPLASVPHSPLVPVLLIIDSIHEGEGFQRSIASFLAAYVGRFPPWLKVVMSIETEDVNIVSSLPLQRINLDCTDVKVQEDLLRYIWCKINSNTVVQTNISTSRSERQIARFADHLITVGQGSFLFAKLVLDLLQQNHLVIKSNTFNVVPKSLDEVFTLLFNLKFPSTAAFSKVKPILEICLASLSPLTSLEVFYGLESAAVQPSLSWEDFTQHLQSLTGILIQRKDGSLMISHPALRRWLKENRKFFCDIRSGHTYMALLPVRLRCPLTPETQLDLVYHLSRSCILENEKTLRAMWILLSPVNPSDVLFSYRLLFWPDVKVIKLLLESGADPNRSVHIDQTYPMITLASKLGFTEIVSLLIEFGADCNKTDSAGITPLIAACDRGHLCTTEILLGSGAKTHHQCLDGRCPLSCAAEKGHFDIVRLLLQNKYWPSTFFRSQAIERALMAASGAGNMQICEYLVAERGSSGSALQDFKSACYEGQDSVCHMLLDNVQYGPRELCLASARGHIPVLRILAEKGVPIDAKDETGRTALHWACVNDRNDAVQFLLKSGANTAIRDNESFTAIHLSAVYGSADLINSLVNHGADPELKNNERKTALECAISAGNYSTLSALLQNGVKVGSRAFEQARDQPKIISMLLRKLLNDGTALYQKGQLSDASYRFEYALKKIAEFNHTGSYQSMRYRLCNELAKCKKKMQFQLDRDGSNRLLQTEYADFMDSYSSSQPALCYK